MRDEFLRYVRHPKALMVRILVS